MTDKILVLVTCGSRKEARQMARALVSTRLAACVNIIDAPVTSIYHWKGKVESAQEFLLLVKTTQNRFRKLENVIQDMHSYDVPEIIAMRIAKGSANYLRWLEEATTARFSKKGS